MGMIRRADLEQAARNARVMDLGDLAARGEALVAEANRRAEEIIRDAKAERDRLIAGARDEGLRAGHAEGLAKGREEGRKQGVDEARKAHAESVASLEAAWTAALEGFEAARDAMLQSARSEIVRLAAEIATRVTRRSVDLDPAAVLPQMEAVLEAVARPTRLTVRVHPEDLALASAELPGLVGRYEMCRHADLVPDPSLDRGSCVAVTEHGGRIDAGVDSQLERIVSALLPEGEVIRLTRPARGDAA